jgi:hypothetical protein
MIMGNKGWRTVMVEALAPDTQMIGVPSDAMSDSALIVIGATYPTFPVELAGSGIKELFTSLSSS